MAYLSSHYPGIIDLAVSFGAVGALLLAYGAFYFVFYVMFDMPRDNRPL